MQFAEQASALGKSVHAIHDQIGQGSPFVGICMEESQGIGGVLVTG